VALAAVATGQAVTPPAAQVQLIRAAAAVAAVGQAVPAAQAAQVALAS